MSDRIFRVSRIEAVLAPHHWPWAEENRERIAAHWAERKAAKPAIFNGRILMVSETRQASDLLHVRFFETDYANLIAWLDWGAPDRSVQNGFAMGALGGADGGFLLGVMAAHTSQAGRIYFPAGTPDLSDVRPDGVVDLTSSITREIEEETGLDSGAYAMEADWIVVMHAGLTGFMRRLTLPIPAEAARNAILAHLAREEAQELADIRIASSPADIDEQAMPGYLKAFLRWSFAT